MGVQKSRKSIRFTKLSRVSFGKKKFDLQSSLKKKKFVHFMLKKHEIKKTRVFYVKQRENENPLFYT